MEKVFKKILFCILLIAVGMMVSAKGYAQNGITTMTFGTLSSENRMRDASPEINNNCRAVEDRGWYYYDNGNNVNAIGLTNGGSIYWGVMFPAGSYTGNVVTKVSMYDRTPHTGNIMIYQGGTDAPGSLLYTQAYSCAGGESFVEWTLDSPVAIDPTQNLWIVMRNNEGQFVASVCNNTGDSNGRWISTDGITWNDLIDVNSDLNYTFMVRAFIETLYSFSWDFDNGMDGWTTIDDDGDGYNWVLGSAIGGIYLVEGASLAGSGHNASEDMVCSGSWTNVTSTILYPDNYLVSPLVALTSGSTFSFWACAQDASYAADHFGVFISNNGTSNWTMINEWTLTAKGNGEMSVGRDGETRAQGSWHQFSVDLSSFAGVDRYIAIRHFNCNNQFVINIDDVALSVNTQYYTITASANPVNGGTVTGGGSYASGSTCTLHATPNSGYTFVKWTKNGAQVSTNPDYSFSVTSNATYVAHFQQSINNYTINVLANPTYGGEVSGGGTYQQGQICTVTAIANEGYTFINWTENGNVVSVNANYSFNVMGNRILVANFQIQCFDVTVTIDPIEGGVVIGEGTYNYGENCTLIAIANDGYSFVCWKKNGAVLSTDPVMVFSVTGNTSYVAQFAQSVNSFTITASADPAEGGSVTGGGNYNQGDACTLTATPNSGYTFSYWTRNGIVVSTESFYTFLVTANATFVANFTQNVSGYSVSVSVNPNNGGIVSGSGLYAPGLTCILTATANDGYRFVNWTENGVIQWLTDQYVFVVDRDRTIEANFEALPTYTISAMSGAYGNIMPQGDVIVVKGTDQTFNMIPDLGGAIVKVLVDGIDIGPIESYTFTNVNRDHTIYVSFSGMGVEEVQELGVIVYPNPTRDVVFVEGANLETVVLYDIQGNCLRSLDYNNGRELNVSGLPQGTYLLRLTTLDGHIGYKKLVLN